MITIDEALAAYARELRPLPIETIAVTTALYRVLAESARSATDLPRFDNSAMDGYALRAGDSADASPDHPVRLPVAQIHAAGDAGAAPLPAGCCARILTGAPLPPGADTVVPQERVQLEPGAILLNAPGVPGRNIRRRGEELRAGSRIADAGARVTPGLLASLVSAGLGELRVRARPRIRVLVSGDELRAAGASLEPGQIHDSNGPLVTSVLERWACPPLSVERLPDREELVRAALETALADADLVISTGGASVGDRDYLPAAARALGLREVFWKVSQKPGKPLWFGVGGDPAANRRSAMLALPGNPGAVLIGLVLHVRRVLDLLEGAEPAAPQWRAGRLSGVVECDSQRERLLRMRLSFAADGTAELHPLGYQDSHMLGNLASADVLVRVGIGEGGLAAGAVLPWIPLLA